MIRLAVAVLVLASFASPVAADPFWRSPNASVEIPPANLGLDPTKPRPEGPCSPQEWLGIWQTEYGEVRLSVMGDTVEGSYEYLNGHITGELDATGCVLSGVWDQDPTHYAPEDTGAFVFVLDKRAKTWTGTWQFNSDPGYVGPWHGAPREDLLNILAGLEPAE
jgi:hypothetical protein